MTLLKITYQPIEFGQNAELPKKVLERMKAGKIRPACHDRTPHGEVRCECGEVMHVHLSQLEPVPAGTEMASRCHGCGIVFLYDRDKAVRGLRKAWGWRS